MDTSSKKINFDIFLSPLLVVPQKQSGKKSDRKASNESKAEKMDTS